MTNEKDKSNTEEIDCLEAIELLYAYLDGELDDEQLEKYEHHMGHCRSCYSRSELEVALNNRIKKSAKGEAPQALQNRLRHLIGKL
ncbi:MAG: zf-HC2 domain-containing protein [Gammaproteobacteria bacterium]|jgi:anti-sigma factor (TIGR02949 family)